jgi:hypothetical protein
MSAKDEVKSENGLVRLVNGTRYHTGDLLAVLNAAERVAREEMLWSDRAAVERALRAALNRTSRPTGTNSPGGVAGGGKPPAPEPPRFPAPQLRCRHAHCGSVSCPGPDALRLVLSDRPLPIEPDTRGFVRIVRGDRVWVQAPKDLPSAPVERLLWGGPSALSPEHVRRLAELFLDLYLRRDLHRCDATLEAAVRGLRVRVRPAHPARHDRHQASRALARLARDARRERNHVRDCVTRISRPPGPRARAGPDERHESPRLTPYRAYADALGEAADALAALLASAKSTSREVSE